MSGSRGSVSLASKVTPISHYTLEPEIIGRGSYGSVYKGRHTATGTVVALKRLNPCEEPLEQKLFVRELEILARTNHPSTLQLFGYQPPLGDEGAIIVTRFMSKGTLEQATSKEYRGVTSPDWTATEKSIVMFGICAGMAYLHSEGIIHRDLKPANIFLNDNCEPVVADFGTSRWVAADLNATDKRGTPLTQPPEDELSYAFDVFSFAVTLHQMFTLSPELDSKRGKVTFSASIKSGSRLKRPAGVPDKIWNLIVRAWDADPKNRPTFWQIIQQWKTTSEFILDGADWARVGRYVDKVYREFGPPKEPTEDIEPLTRDEAHNFMTELDQFIASPIKLK
jgi:serine/threonine protein kinase